MKIRYLFFIALCSLLFSCHDLNLNPLSSASSGNWYATEEEIVMSLNDFYKIAFFTKDSENWTDNQIYRNILSGFHAGTVDSQNSTFSTYWLNKYKMIARANNIINNIERAIDNGGNAGRLNVLLAEARFFRGCAYLFLTSKFGDVPYTDRTLSIEEGKKVGRTAKKTVDEKAYADLDYAIKNLPVSYADVQRVTKGAALAMKARFALYNKDYELAKKAAWECMQLDKYKLHPDFSDLFLQSTKNSVETILGFGRSIDLGITKTDTKSYVSRTAGGFAMYSPSWDLLASFLCTDGLPIDESPLFDPHDPFKNRDPRCAATIVPFGTPYLGYIYDPSPLAKQVEKLSTGKW